MITPTDAGYDAARRCFNALVVWQDAALDEQHIEWARDTAAALEPWSFSGGGYVNYMQADEPIERVRAAFGPWANEHIETFERWITSGKPA